MQYTDGVSQNCTLKVYVISLTNVPQTNLIKDKSLKKKPNSGGGEAAG